MGDLEPERSVAAGGSDAAGRGRLLRAIAATLSAAAERQVVVLILDDIQWADDVTLGLLAHLGQAKRIEKMGLLIVASYRTEELGPEHAALRELPGVHHVVLGPLDEAAVGQMAAEMLALEQPPPSFAAYLSRVSEGNPFFVGEHLRTAVAEGLLDRDDEGTWVVRGAGDAARRLEELPIPTAIHGIVSRRLDALPAGAQELLVAAAVFPRPVSIGLLQRASGLAEEQLLDRVDVLVARQVLVEARGELRFLHGRIREVAYARLDEPSRRRGHASAASALEMEPDRDAHLAELGHHHDRAGERGAARACYLPAARAAVARGILARAEELYRAYLALVDELDEESVMARLELGGKVLLLRGRMEEAMALAAQAAGEARRAGLRRAEAMAVSALAFAELQTGRLPEAESRYRAALELFRELGERGEEARNLGELGATLIPLGRHEEVRALFAAALAVHEELGNLHQQAVLTGNLAAFEHMCGRFDVARLLYEKALTGHRAVRNYVAESHVLGNLAWMLHEQGELDAARDVYDQALAASVRYGLRTGEGAVVANLGLWHEERGELDLAQAQYEKALAIARDIGERRLVAHLLVQLASLSATRVQYGRAAELHREAAELIATAGDRRAAVVLDYQRARADQAAGLTDAALELLDAVAGAARAVGDQRHVALAAIARADILLERGQVEAAGAIVAGLATSPLPTDTLLPRVRSLEARLHAARGDVERARALHEEVARTARGAGDADALLDAATFARRDGDFGSAAARLDRLEVIAGADTLHAFLARIERAHLALATGPAAAADVDAELALHSVRGALDALRPPGESQLRRRADRLERAFAARAAGAGLVEGEAHADRAARSRR